MWYLLLLKNFGCHALLLCGKQVSFFHIFKFCSDFSDTYWSLQALSCSLNLWSCLLLMLLLMRFLPLRSDLWVSIIFCVYLFNIEAPFCAIPLYVPKKNVWQDLLTKHDTMVSEYLTAHYDEVCLPLSFFLYNSEQI